MMKKKLLSALAVLACLFVLVLPAYAEQDGPDVKAEGYIAMNMDTGEIVLSRNMDVQQYPASITKILTALVVLENVDDLDDTLTFSENAVNGISADSSTLSPKASVGETMTVRDALYGMVLCSANECAAALAEYTAGSIEQFAVLMNARAEQAGAVNSHFVNPHGLHDDNHYTTPHDMAMIFMDAMKNAEFAKLFSTVHYTIPATNQNPARECTNTDQLLNGTITNGGQTGVFAGKTGHTPQAGRTLVTACERYNVRLVVVVMKSDNACFYTDTETLLEYAYGKVTGAYPEPVQQERDDYVTISTSSLRMRQYASVYSAVVGSLQKGDRVHRTGTYAGWSQIEDSGEICYVASQYLVDDSGQPAETAYETAEATTAEPRSEDAAAAGQEDGSEAETEAAVQPSDSAAVQMSSAAAVQSAAADADAAQTAAAVTVTAADAAGQRDTENITWELTRENLRQIIILLGAAAAVLCGLLVTAVMIRHGRNEA